MYHFFIQDDLIFPNQSFSNKATFVYKLTSITHDIYQSLDQGYEVRGVSFFRYIEGICKKSSIKAFYSNLTKLYQQSFSKIPLLFLGAMKNAPRKNAPGKIAPQKITPRKIAPAPKKSIL